MAANPRVMFPDTRGTPLSVVGTEVTVLSADRADLKITLQRGEEGTGPPPHHHDWDEAFYVTRGQVNFAFGGTLTNCPAGTLVHVPAGTVHAFSYGPGGGEMLEMTGPRSQAVTMFAALDKLATAGEPKPEQLVATAAAHGVVLTL
ncbi:MAG: cupin domain-containing protein [Proteobacteria bacterium]|nr:MAG: cupin domain-containing protein [Pseudomonadota bacterium]